MIFQDYDRIVFAGDSVTDMGSVQPVGEGLNDNVGRSYVRIIENMLSAFYPEVRVRVTNAGIGGNTSRDLLERFERDVVALDPDWVSICIGINDVWRQFDTPAMPDYQVMPEEYEENLEKMIAMIPKKVKGVFILTPYYMESNRADKMRARMRQNMLQSAKSLPKSTALRLLIFRRYTRITAKSVIPPILHGTACIRIRLEPR